MNQLTKRRLVLTCLVLILLLLLHWVIYTSKVEITVSGNSTGNISYKLLNQKSQKNFPTVSASATVNKRVPRGNYEVQVTQGDESYFAVVKTRSIFSKTIVSGALKQQKSRQFVGNNPSACSGYANGVLLSYACNDIYANINIHVPATPYTPTYVTKSSSSGVTGNVQGSVTLDGKLLFLIRHSVYVDAPPYYSIDEVGTDLSIKKEINLPGVDAKKNFYIQPYKTGFIVYDSAFSQIFYYSSEGATAQKIAFGSPSDSSLEAVSFNADNSGNIVALFSSAVNSTSGSARTEVLVSSEGVTTDFKLKQGYSSAEMCGTNKLCLLQKTNLQVYDIKGKKLQRSFLVSGVAAMAESGQSFLVINGSGIINFDTVSRTGFYEYVFGDYKFNSIQRAEDGYVLDLTNIIHNNIALYINQGAADNGDIDQKVEFLQKTPGIQTVSAYGRYLYIIPALGPQTLIPSGGFGYAPAILKAANAKIQAAITKSGLNTSQYTVINPYQ